MTAVSTETPISASKPSTDETLKGVCVSLSAISAPTGSVSNDAKGNRHREFEVSVKRKQDHEDDQHSQRADEFHLVLCLKKFAVLATPGEPIPGRQGLLDVRDGIADQRARRSPGRALRRCTARQYSASCFRDR